MTDRAQIIVVGCGPGHPDYLSDAVRHAVACAEVLVGAKHLLDLFPATAATCVPVGADIPAVLARIESEQKQRVVVLVSGDTGLFSLARTIQGHFGAQQCRLIPGISSVQVACARLGLDWHDLKVVSAHGRHPEESVNALQGYGKIAILAGTAQATRWAADLLEQLGSAYRAFACENLTWDEECITPYDASGLAQAELASRTIIILVARKEMS